MALNLNHGREATLADRAGCRAGDTSRRPAAASSTPRTIATAARAVSYWSTPKPEGSRPGPSHGSVDLPAELTQTQVETATPVCRKLDEFRARLAWQRGALAGPPTGWGAGPWPWARRCCLTPGLESAEQCHAVVDALVESGVVLDRAILYWWVRSSAAS